MKNDEGKKRGSIACRTDRANEANKMFIIWLFEYSGKGTFSQVLKRVWSRTVTYLELTNAEREISQLYTKLYYTMLYLTITQAIP